MGRRSERERSIGHHKQTSGIAAGDQPQHRDGADLKRLERRMGARRRTFVEVGRALHEINDRRLYRISGCATFSEYIDRRWDISRAYAYRKMAAATVVEILRSAGVERLPVNEAQARELSPLAEDPEALLRAWLHVLEDSATSGLTAAAIRSVVVLHHSGDHGPRP